MNNGETLVLGGIYQQTIKSDVTKVPLLGDIPGLGALFRKTTSENKKAGVADFRDAQDSYRRLLNALHVRVKHI